MQLCLASYTGMCSTKIWEETFQEGECHGIQDIDQHQRETKGPTPVFLPREPQGLRGLVGCRLWGRTESDTTEAT